MPTKEEIRQFSLMIEDKATNLRCTRMDAILEHCKETGLEVEVASTLISTVLKSKIREEAQELNLIKKTSKLPL
jgi:aryl-alcohol dehydrogenase-like predicted oxidoreductase